MKKLVKHFLLETRAGKWIMRSLALINTAEGIIHLIVSAIGAWGLIATNTYDVRAWLPVYENFLFGFLSIVTGWALQTKGGHMH
jgi:hypothetical protein